MTIQEYSRLKEPFKKQGFMNFEPYPCVQRALDDGSIREYREDGELFGFVWVINLKRKDVSRIEEIVCTKRGYGHLILKDAISMCRNKRIELKVVDTNEYAIAFYKRNGFVEESIKKGKVNLITMVYESSK